MPPALEHLARRLIWWKPPEEALRWPERLLAQVMTLGTWDDIQTARKEWGDAGFRQVLANPPPGVFDKRSWNYWHVVFNLTPVPPLPVRTIPAMSEPLFQLNPEILPPAQRRLWDAGLAVPEEFVLYGGTALAVRLGHRQSVDFDFFSASEFIPGELVKRMPFAADSVLLQSGPNTLTFCTSPPEGEVKFSFFGGIHWPPVLPAVRLPNGVAIASPEDLFGTKLADIIQRSEAKDYLDIAALLACGMDLAYGLACARAFYGANFNVALPLKALCWFGDGDLTSLPQDVRRTLTVAAQNVRALPDVTGTGGRIGRSVVPA